MKKDDVVGIRHKETGKMFSITDYQRMPNYLIGEDFDVASEDDEDEEELETQEHEEETEEFEKEIYESPESESQSKSIRDEK